MTTEHALIVGVGAGLRAALARAFPGAGLGVALAARDVARLAGLASETDATVHACDASDPRAVQDLFASLDATVGTPDIVIYNPSARVRGAITDIDAEAVRAALMVSCFGAFLVGQAAARRMLPRGSGSIFFTGATAGIKGFARSASFAMGKFGLRGLAQSMARELGPQGLHIAHFVIDGSIGAAGNTGPEDRQLDPDAIARSYLAVHRQHRSAWSEELAVRPWVERF